MKGLPVQSQKVLFGDLVGPEGTHPPRPGAAHCEEGGGPGVSGAPWEAQRPQKTRVGFSFFLSFGYGFYVPS